MITKLVPDAWFDWLEVNHILLASAETVTIQPGQVQVVHTGLYTHEPLALSFQKGNEKLDMCALLTTALTAEQEVKVAVLNRGTDPVTLVPGEMPLVACRLGVAEPIDNGI
nr:MAG TPA: POL POLYPROTEIN [Caudoviricetes sp.]